MMHENVDSVIRVMRHKSGKTIWKSTFGEYLITYNSGTIPDDIFKKMMDQGLIKERFKNGKPTNCYVLATKPDPQESELSRLREVKRIALMVVDAACDFLENKEDAAMSNKLNSALAKWAELEAAQKLLGDR